MNTQPSHVDAEPHVNPDLKTHHVGVEAVTEDHLVVDLKWSKDQLPVRKLDMEHDVLDAARKALESIKNKSLAEIDPEGEVDDVFAKAHEANEDASAEAKLVELFIKEWQKNPKGLAVVESLDIIKDIVPREASEYKDKAFVIPPQSGDTFMQGFKDAGFSINEIGADSGDGKIGFEAVRGSERILFVYPEIKIVGDEEKDEEVEVPEQETNKMAA